MDAFNRYIFKIAHQEGSVYEIKTIGREMAKNVLDILSSPYSGPNLSYSVERDGNTYGETTFSDVTKLSKAAIEEILKLYDRASIVDLTVSRTKQPPTKEERILEKAAEELKR